MAIQTCPTAIVHAPPERVWHLLTNPADLQRWSGVRIVRGPDRPLSPGDQIVFQAGSVGFLKVTFDVLEAEPSRRLRLDVRLPFGIVNHENVVITPISDSECRVTFN